MKTIILLGADDPEMRAMVKILNKNRAQHIAYATVNGQRVHPGQAYRAEAVVGLLAGDTLVCIECRPVYLPPEVEVVVIDHHRPGDPGYDLGPKEFWEASSIGQLHVLLDIAPTDNAKLIAAMDHCPSAALRNECPGVFGLEVLLRGVHEISISTKTGHGRVMQQIHNLAGLLEIAPQIMIGNQMVRDLRSKYLGEKYSLDLLAAQISTSMRGHVALLYHRDTKDGPKKYTLVGHTQPETVEAFMTEWAPKQGLVNIYGVPSRGYGGAREAS